MYCREYYIYVHVQVGLELRTLLTSSESVTDHRFRWYNGHILCRHDTTYSTMSAPNFGISIWKKGI